MKIINNLILASVFAMTGACSWHEHGGGRHGEGMHDGDKHGMHNPQSSAGDAMPGQGMNEHKQAMHKHMQDMHKNMQDMQETMQKIQQTKSTTERQKLMQQHMTMMQDNMKMMSCPGMDGMKKDQKSPMPMPMMQGGKQCPMGGMGMMMQHMNMMQQMMDQMMQHMAAQQATKK